MESWWNQTDRCTSVSNNFFASSYSLRIWTLLDNFRSCLTELPSWNTASSGEKWWFHRSTMMPSQQYSVASFGWNLTTCLNFHLIHNNSWAVTSWMFITPNDSTCNCVRWCRHQLCIGNSWKNVAKLPPSGFQPKPSKWRLVVRQRNYRHTSYSRHAIPLTHTCSLALGNVLNSFQPLSLRQISAYEWHWQWSERHGF